VHRVNRARRRRLDLVRTAAPPVLILAFQIVVFPLPSGAMLSGAILGLVGALAAVGLALIWRANRVVNFAQGDLGAFPATLTVLLITLSGLPWLVGVGLGLVAAVVVGVLADVLVVRRFARSPRLLLTVATLGVAQVLAFGTLLLPELWGDGPKIRRMPPPFELNLQVGGVGFNANDLIAVLVAPVLLGAVALMLRRTDTGVAVRAAAERIDRAATLGVPVRRLETRVWVLATLLSFASVTLTAGISGLSFGLGLGLAVLLRALTAVVAGRMTHLVAIAATSVALGVLESGVRWNTGDIALMGPILAVIVLLSLLLYRAGTTRAEREDQSSWQAGAETHELPREVRTAPRVRLLRYGSTLMVAVVVVVAPAFMGTNGQLKAGVVAAFALVGVSIVVLTGWAGQVSLGQMAFVGAGAAVGAVGMSEHGWDPFVALLVGGATGAVVAVLVGLPALRVRGLYLAVVTLAIGIAASEWVFSNRARRWIPETSFPRPSLFHRIPLDTPLRLYWFALAVVVLAVGGLAGLRRSRTGRVLVAMRDNEPGVVAFGVSPTLAKLTAFAASGFVAAAAGVVIVVQQGAFRAETYAPGESVSALVATVVGGLGSLGGGVLGAVVQRGAQWMLPAPWSILATGLGALIVLLIAPGGVAGWVLRLRDRLAFALVGRRGTFGVPEPDAGTSAAPARSASAAVPVAPPLLEVEGLRAGYGDLVVVHGIDLQVAPGEIVALLGGNGAGKTTTLRAVTGVLAPVGGRVRFDGRDLTGAPADRVAAAGCTQVPGGEGVFPGLSVRENLRIGGWLIRNDDVRLAEREAAALEAFPPLAGRLDEPAANLSGGQQQMLALAMALMSEPKLLVIDELSLGLAPLVVGQLAAMVRAVAESGTAVLLVEQSLNVALTMAHRAVFLEHGTVRFSGPAHEMASRDDLLREVFLAGGGEVAPAPAPAPAGPARPGPAEPALPADALQAVDLVRRFGGIEAVSHVSFRVGAGEIVGLIGQNGAGKTTVVDLVSGYQRADHGIVRLAGRDVTEVPARRRFAHGLGRTFQGGRLFPGLTVDEAIAVGLEQSLLSRSLLDAAFRLPAWADTEAAVAARVDELVDTFALGAHRDHFVSDLSTGTRRVVELAAAVAHQPTLLLLDEPAAGLAQPEVESLVGLLRRIRSELGCAILLIEHDMPLVAAVSDRLVALESGSVIAEGVPAAVLEDPLVVASYLGSDGAAVARSDAGATPVVASSPMQEGGS
jgi:branched-chain amino acid transport system permease protein